MRKLKHINKVNPTTDLLKLEMKAICTNFYGLDYIENVYSTIDSIKFFKEQKHAGNSLN